jgi:hypothetical protein
VSALVGLHGGDSPRSSGSSLTSEPSTTSRKMPIAASRVGADCAENGLSGPSVPLRS